MNRIPLFLLVLLSVATRATNLTSYSATDLKANYEYFIDFFVSEDPLSQEKALHFIQKNWKESDEILAIETLYFSKQPTRSFKLLLVLEKMSGQHFGYDYNKWYEYIWNKPFTYTNDYFTFKAIISSRLDSRFGTYFLDRQLETAIRLDEIRWGGVIQDGIPPLRNPAMISVKEATYLKDSNVVFGIAINGDVRAYPKRILAWHEMFTDTVGNLSVTGVYCTLCGTVILYKNTHNGKNYSLGTSGFLYRSNKLMYDKSTQSLWNTLEGKPVVGPLVNKGIQLDYLSVVTTTWGAWKKRHPDTKVLSVQTGHDRNYGEGIAYKAYFGTDDLMFSVPKVDKRLKNKQEILAIRLPSKTKESIAISSRFLQRKSIYKDQIHNISFTVFTDRSGAHRVYYTDDIAFSSYDKRNSTIDKSGKRWTLHENYLEQEDTGKRLKRFQSFSAFWFGYKAAFPDTRLVK
jgi:hypothetical protein